MQREILFRGKRTDTDEWAYGSFIPDLLEVYTIDPDGKWGGDWGFIKPFGRTKEERMMVEVYRDTVGQFIGLLDRNGKRIFEGDIMQYVDPDEGVDENEVYVVRKPEWYAGFMGETIVLGKSIEFSSIDENYCGYMEVIGNAHDNPQLFWGGKPDGMD